MAHRFRSNSQWSHFALVAICAVALMVIDARTDKLASARNFLSVIVAPVQILAAVPSRLERWVAGQLTAEPDIKIAYQNLRNEYFQLKSEALLLRALEEENKSLRSMLDASQRIQEKITLAELANVQIDRDQHQILVEKGLRHGVYGGQAVIDDQGIIGQVIDVMPFNSSVMLITDPAHAMPVQVQRTGLRTFVFGTGSVSVLRVPFLNQHADVKTGDVLISSGLGGRFPNGYPVATVTSVKVIEDESFMQITAAPIAKLDRSNHVLLLYREPQEGLLSNNNKATLETKP